MILVDELSCNPSGVMAKGHDLIIFNRVLLAISNSNRVNAQKQNVVFLL